MNRLDFIKNRQQELVKISKNTRRPKKAFAVMAGGVETIVASLEVDYASMIPDHIAIQPISHKLTYDESTRFQEWMGEANAWLEVMQEVNECAVELQNELDSQRNKP